MTVKQYKAVKYYGSWLQWVQTGLEILATDDESVRVRFLHFPPNKLKCISVAQLAELRIPNPMVVGSTPTRYAKKFQWVVDSYNSNRPIGLWAFVVADDSIHQFNGSRKVATYVSLSKGLRELHDLDNV